MLTINVSEVILTVINFFLLYFLLKRFLYEPLIKFMDERQARIDAGAAVKKQALDTVKESEDRMEAELRESREEAKRIISDAKAADEAAHAELGEKLRESRLEAMRENEAHVDALRCEESTELDMKSRELAKLLAAKLLSETGND